MENRSSLSPFIHQRAGEKVQLRLNKQEKTMKLITILTSTTCSYCHAAKKLLQLHDIDFQEVDLHKDSEQAQQLLIQSGQRTVPQIFINDKPIGGFTELSQLIANNDFDFTGSTAA